MSEWREVPLGEVLEVHHGYAFKGAHFGAGGVLRLVTPGNFIEAGGFKDRGEKQKSYDGPVPDQFVLDPEDLVVAMTEQSPGLLGSSGFVPGQATWLHNQRIGRVRLRDGSTNKRFIYYLFNEPSVRAQISATATGAKVRHTAPERLHAVRARIPSAQTQTRVASLLAAFDEIIEINERRIELLEDLARSLYREWFVRLRFPGREGSARAVDGVIDDVAQLCRRATHPSRHPETTFEHFSIPAFDAERLPAKELGASIKSGKYALDGESVLLSKINPRIARTWFAVPTTEASVASTEFLPWRGKAVSNAWLWATFSDGGFRSWLVGAAGGTSTSHQRAKPDDVAIYPVRIPDRQTLRVFDSLAEPALRETNVLRRHNQALARTRDLLLPRLVTGRLDVSKIDLDELLSREDGE